MLIAASAGAQAIPKQVPGVKPCPGFKAPRVYEAGGHAAVEVQMKMNVDVDGAPNAYGPKGKRTLDNAAHCACAA